VFFNILWLTNFDRGKRSYRECCGSKGRIGIYCVLEGMWKLRTIRNRNRYRKMCVGKNSKQMSRNNAKTGKWRKQLKKKVAKKITKYN
jgi:hypothetical protein